MPIGGVKEGLVYGFEEHMYLYSHFSIRGASEAPRVVDIMC